MGVESPQGMPCILRLVNRASAGRRGRRPLRRSRGLRAAGCGHPALRSRRGAASIGVRGGNPSVTAAGRDSSCCGAQNSMLAERSQNFDRCHSLASLPLPPAALGSLPLYTREPWACGGQGSGRPRRAAPTQGWEFVETNGVGVCGSPAAGRDGARPQHGGGCAVVFVTGREWPGSAERSGERGKRSWSIRSLPDEGGVQHGAQCSEV